MVLAIMRINGSHKFNKMKALIRAIIPIKYRQHLVMFHFRRWLNFNFILRKKLLEQLTYKNKNASKPGNNGLRIFVPIIETSHYHIFQILILSKALQLRGANVKILISRFLKSQSNYFVLNRGVVSAGVAPGPP